MKPDVYAECFVVWKPHEYLSPLPPSCYAILTIKIIDVDVREGGGERGGEGPPLLKNSAFMLFVRKDLIMALWESDYACAT